MRSGRAYVLTGGAGSGKTECALRFADAGLRVGERVAMVVHASAAELSAHAGFLGVDLKRPLATGRLLVLRYRLDFFRRLARAASPDEVIDDLHHRILGHAPQRLVVDTFGPLLDDGSPSMRPAAALAELLEVSQCTALLTYPSELGASYDRRLEPLLQRAAGVLRLARTPRSGSQVEIVSLRDRTASLPEPLDSMLEVARRPGRALDESLAGDLLDGREVR